MLYFELTADDIDFARGERMPAGNVGVDFVRTSGFCRRFIHESNHVCVVRGRTTGFVAASKYRVFRTVWYSPYE